MDPDLVAFTDRLNAAFAQCGHEEVEGLIGFPQWKCTVASRIAAALLEEHGFGTWQLVEGRRLATPDVGKHVWLERDGLLYDPTIHQRDDFDAPLLGRNEHPLVNEQFAVYQRAAHDIDKHTGLKQARGRVQELVGMGS
ncbi:hypothetical protein H9623_13175 [Oerskovia sp. Sa1BUA8]|uniref:Uncharacterized protein n=1 Tax=Oerskovia douganii TaxID=2762210 RepID=A0A9D5UAP3_9CELL|nr:hypothetical protein [Oerskovia douganii]MBE7701248.1 hypothetical protein [Oerskovia douganii]